VDGKEAAIMSTLWFVMAEINGRIFPILAGSGAVRLYKSVELNEVDKWMKEREATMWQAYLWIPKEKS
jgi:hypothetical protein